jgi:hypothetical protein
LQRVVFEIVKDLVRFTQKGIDDEAGLADIEN